MKEIKLFFKYHIPIFPDVVNEYSLSLNFIHDSSFLSTSSAFPVLFLLPCGRCCTASGRTVTYAFPSYYCHESKVRVWWMLRQHACTCPQATFFTPLSSRYVTAIWAGMDGGKGGLQCRWAGGNRIEQHGWINIWGMSLADSGTIETKIIHK